VFHFPGPLAITDMDDSLENFTFEYNLKESARQGDQISKCIHCKSIYPYDKIIKGFQ
jgi:hypothetical protein